MEKLITVQLALDRKCAKKRVEWYGFLWYGSANMLEKLIESPSPTKHAVLTSSNASISDTLVVQEAISTTLRIGASRCCSVFSCSFSAAVDRAVVARAATKSHSIDLDAGIIQPALSQMKLHETSCQSKSENWYRTGLSVTNSLPTKAS